MGMPYSHPVPSILVREARPFQSVPEITEDSVIDGDPERLDRVARRSDHVRGYPRGAFPARFVELVHGPAVRAGSK